MIRMIVLATLLLKALNAGLFLLAEYVENHTNFTTGPTRLKSAISSFLWRIA